MADWLKRVWRSHRLRGGHRAGQAYHGRHRAVARAAGGPAWDSSSTRDAEGRWRNASRTRAGHKRGRRAAASLGGRVRARALGYPKRGRGSLEQRGGRRLALPLRRQAWGAASACRRLNLSGICRERARIAGSASNHKRPNTRHGDRRLPSAQSTKPKGKLRGPYCSSWELIAAAALRAPILRFRQHVLYVWQDASGQSHELRQSEGGELDDQLMPALYASLPTSTTFMSSQFPSASGNRTPANGHFASTRALTQPWQNQHLERSGGEPAHISDLPRDRQGLVVLGTLLGTDEYVHGILAAKRAEHERLLTRIPEVPDPSGVAPSALLRRPGPTTSCGTSRPDSQPSSLRIATPLLRPA